MKTIIGIGLILFFTTVGKHFMRNFKIHGFGKLFKLAFISLTVVYCNEDTAAELKFSEAEVKNTEDSKSRSDLTRPDYDDEEKGYSIFCEQTSQNKILYH